MSEMTVHLISQKAIDDATLRYMLMSFGFVVAKEDQGSDDKLVLRREVQYDSGITQVEKETFSFG